MMNRQTFLCRSTLGLALLGVGLLANCAPQQTAAPAVAPAVNQNATDGTVTFTGGAVAAGIGFQWGSGTLTFRGAQYPFRVRGLSVIDIGVSQMTASGVVQNLHNVADFSGNYVSATAGATVAGGASASVLRNQNGVTIQGISTTRGLRLTLAPGGINITLTGQ
jgi:hypothetical protein